MKWFPSKVKLAYSHPKLYPVKIFMQQHYIGAIISPYEYMVGLFN